MKENLDKLYFQLKQNTVELDNKMNKLYQFQLDKFVLNPQIKELIKEINELKEKDFQLKALIKEMEEQDGRKQN